MTHHFSFHSPEDEAFDDLVRQALALELNQLPGPSSEVWRTLAALIQIEPGLLTSDLNTEYDTEPRAGRSARRRTRCGQRRRGRRGG
jgi:hypothetical protein